MRLTVGRVAREDRYLIGRGLFPEGNSPVAFGVFVYRPDSIYDDSPWERYQFPRSYLARVEACRDDWVIYYEPRKVRNSRGYFAVARVQQVIPDLSTPDMHVAVIAPGSYAGETASLPRGNSPAAADMQEERSAFQQEQSRAAYLGLRLAIRHGFEHQRGITPHPIQPPPEPFRPGSGWTLSHRCRPPARRDSLLSCRLAAHARDDRPGASHAGASAKDEMAVILEDGAFQHAMRFVSTDEAQAL